MRRITEGTKAFVQNNFKNTELGLRRIKKNLQHDTYSDNQIIGHCRKIIGSIPLDDVEEKGKNYYFISKKYKVILTINKSSLGIITAKKYITQ